MKVVQRMAVGAALLPLVILFATVVATGGRLDTYDRGGRRTGSGTVSGGRGQ